MQYDSDNVFARILRGDLPCERVFENEFALAIQDIAPQAPVHVLIMAKGHYSTLDQLCREAPADQVSGFFRAIGDTARRLGIDESGYRVVVNSGIDSGQEVPHVHVHLLGGGPLGPVTAMPRTRDANDRPGGPLTALPGERSERTDPRYAAHDPKSKQKAGPNI